MVIDGNKINASGKLWYHFNYRKSILREDKLLQKRKSNNTVQSTLSEDIIAKLNVLKTLVDPWNKVATLWSETFEARRTYLIKQKAEIETYLKSHACLRVDRTLYLFESDFNCLFPENVSLLQRNWPKTRNFLIKKLSVLKIRNAEDKGLVHFLQTLPPGLFSIFCFKLLNIFFQTLNKNEIYCRFSRYNFILFVAIFNSCWITKKKTF